MFFAVINCLTVAFGGRVQSVLTVLKLGGIAAVMLGVFVRSGTADWSHLAATGAARTSSGASAFGLAMLAALWAYDGWNNMPMAAGEVKDPGRNVPRALIGGMAIVMADLLRREPGLLLRAPVQRRDDGEFDPIP